MKQGCEIATRTRVPQSLALYLGTYWAIISKGIPNTFCKYLKSLAKRCCKDTRSFMSPAIVKPRQNARKEPEPCTFIILFCSCLCKEMCSYASWVKAEKLAPNPRQKGGRFFASGDWATGLPRGGLLAGAREVLSESSPLLRGDARSPAPWDFLAASSCRLPAQEQRLAISVSIARGRETTRNYHPPALSHLSLRLSLCPLQAGQRMLF